MTIKELPRADFVLPEVLVIDSRPCLTARTTRAKPQSQVDGVA